jgi:CelD/BcsL family acetyltransferase involved in cellulose biosynthesis
MDLRSTDWISPAFVAHDPAPSSVTPAGAAASGYAVEMRTAAEMEAEVGAWRDLAKRAVEPNVFAEPELVLAGMQHLPDGRGVMLLLVWEGERSTAAGGLLRAVFPLLMPRPALVRRIRTWCPGSASPAVPLVDRKAPAEVIEAALAFLAAHYARFTGLAFPQVPTDGAFAAALRSAALRTGRALVPCKASRRKVLVDAPGFDAAKGLRRRIIDDLHDGRQRLSVLGDVEMDHTRTARWVRDAVEELLVLDATGAAGKREALLQATGMASFLRTATRRLAHAGRCRVDVLRAGGRAVAAAIVIESGQHAWLWHLASDASLAGLSPDTQLMLDVTRTQIDRPGLARTEACAGHNAAVVQDLWQERMVADYRVALRPQSSPAALAARIGERLIRTLRSATDSAYSRPVRP